MAKLYPPNIEGTIPAFCGTTLVVPFSMNKAVGKSEVGGFIVKIKTVNGDLKGTVAVAGSTLAAGFYSGTLSSTSYYDITSDMTVTFDTSSISFTIGQYYKIQLAYIGIDGVIGYYSTVGVVKYTTNPKISISGLTYGTLNTHRYYYTGIYSQLGQDTTERMYSSRFYVMDENYNIIDDTGEALHNITNDDSPYEGQEQYQLLADLESDKNYYIVFQVTTTNGLVVTTPKYRIAQRSSISPDITFDLVATADYDNGYIGLTLENSNRKAISGTFLLSRASSINNYAWEELRRIDMHGTITTKWSFLDCIVEQGASYKYSLQQYNENGIYSDRIVSKVYVNNKLVEKEIKADFEDMFLFDGEKQLRIKFNPKVSSFKPTILEAKQDTIGSKYPFITRNGNVNYKDFPISGLISYQMDENEMFVDKEDIGIEHSLLEEQKVINTNYNEIEEESTYKAVGTLEWNDDKQKFVTSDTKEEYEIGKLYYQNTKGEYILENRDLGLYNQKAVDYYPVKVHEKMKARTNNYYIYNAKCPVCGAPLSAAFNDILCPDCSSYLFVSGEYYHKYGTESAYEKKQHGSLSSSYQNDDFVKLNYKKLSTISNDKNQYYDDLSDGLERYAKGRIYYIKEHKQYYIREVSYNYKDKSNIITTESKLYNTSTNLTSENIAAERRFKMKVLDWLTNGKVKLFRSPTEGNFIIRLMNVSLSPTDTLGRMLHTFSCNAYEIAEFNFESLETYGIIDPTENIITDTKWATVVLPSIKQSGYNVDSSGWVLISGDPVYTLQVTDMLPGSKIRLDGEVIIIGATGIYSYSSEEVPINRIYVQENSLNQGSITIGTREKNVTMFEQVSDIDIADVPIRQFIGENYKTKENNDLLAACQNIRDKIFSINFMRFIRRETKEIYIKVSEDMYKYLPQTITWEDYQRYNYYIKNPDVNGSPKYIFSSDKFDENETYYLRLISINPKKNYTFYEDMDCTIEATLEEIYLYKIRLQRNDYRYNYIQNEQYFVDAMNDYLAPYTNMMVDGSSLKIFEETSDIYEIIFNESEPVSIMDTARYYLPDTSTVETVSSNKGVIAELSYTQQSIEYTFETTVATIKAAKLNYLQALSQYLDDRDSGAVAEGRGFTTLAAEREYVKNLQNVFLTLLEQEVANYKKEHGIEE